MIAYCDELERPYRLSSHGLLVALPILFQAVSVPLCELYDDSESYRKLRRCIRLSFVPPVIAFGGMVAGADLRHSVLLWSMSLSNRKAFGTLTQTNGHYVRTPRCFLRISLRIHHTPKTTSLWFPAFRREQTPSMLKKQPDILSGAACYPVCRIDVSFRWDKDNLSYE